MTTDEKLDKGATDLAEIRTEHRLAEREVTRAREAIRKMELEGDVLARDSQVDAHERLQRAEIAAKQKRIELNSAEDAFVKTTSGMNGRGER